MPLNVSFNSQSLTTWNGTNGIMVQSVEHAGKSAKQAQTYALSHGNKSSIPFVEWPSKPITITGKIVGTSISDCDSQIDTFNSYLTASNAPLTFDYNGGSLNRQYTATCTNVDVRRPGYLAWAEFTVVFTATTPFGSDTTSTTLLSTSGRTSQAYQDSITLLGTAPFQLPVITITYSAIGSAPVAGTVYIGNNGTGQQLAVTRTWAATDVLIVDCTQYTCSVGGTLVDFTGAFPVFVTGSGVLDYSDSFASRTFAISAVYNKNYM